MPGSTPGYRNSAIAAVALWEWSFAIVQAGTSSIFPSHSQARLGDIRDQEPFSIGSFHTAFLFRRLRELNGRDKRHQGPVPDLLNLLL